MNEGDAHFDAGRYEQALASYNKAVESDPENKKAMAKQDEARNRLREWAVSIALEAKRSEDSGFPATASILYKKSSIITGDTEHKSKSQSLWEAVRNQLAFKVDFKARRGSVLEDINLFYFNNRFDQAVSRLPGNPWIAVSRNSAAPHVTFAVELGRPVTARKQEVINRSTRYVSGTSEVPNERYGALQGQLDQEKKAYADSKWEEDKYQKEVSYFYAQSLQTGPGGKKNPYVEEKYRESLRNLGYIRERRNSMQNNINSLGYQLANTPRTSRINQYSNYAYADTNHTISVSAPVQIVAHRDGMSYNYFIDRLVIEHSDCTHPAHPVAGINEDPLVLPDEEAIGDELINDVITRTKSAMSREFLKHQEQIRNKANGEISPEKKMESLIACAMLDPQSIEDAEWQPIISQLVVKVGNGGTLGPELLK